MAKLDLVQEGIYRISISVETPGGPFSFNEFLITDEKSALIHTGSAPQFDEMAEKLWQAAKPADLKYVFISHFEADECGALSKLLALNRDIVPVCSQVTARQLTGFGLHPKPMTMKDGDELSLGKRKLRFISYPSEAHLWEGLLAYEVTGQILFSSDLFISRGREEAPVKKAARAEALKIPEASIAVEAARHKLQDALDNLEVALVCPGHGPALDLRG